MRKILLFIYLVSMTLITMTCMSNE
jgi:hypothetical protein